MNTHRPICIVSSAGISSPIFLNSSCRTARRILALYSETPIPTMNFLPIAMRSSSGTSFHVFCASTARVIFASSSLSVGYVRVTHGCWLWGLMVVWITGAEDIVVRGKIAIACR